MAKTKQQIQEEANRLFGKGASDEKFKWRQEQQRAAGLDVEKRQRGGVAEVWDRNKNVIVPAASGIAALLTGGASAPLAASLTGAALRGADTRSLKGALGGAAEGYASGLGATALKGAATGAMAGTGLKGTLAGAGRGAMQEAGGYVGMGGGETPPKPQRVPSDRGGYVDIGGTAAAPKDTAMSKVLGFAQKNAPLIQGVAGGVSDVIGSRITADVANRRLDLEEQQVREEQARRDRLAQLLMPMFQQQAQQYGSQRRG
jgi:hypothetical protein